MYIREGADGIRSDAGTMPGGHGPYMKGGTRRRLTRTLTYARCRRAVPAREIWEKYYG